jgi:hypothetical protein
MFVLKSHGDTIDPGSVSSSFLSIIFLNGHSQCHLTFQSIYKKEVAGQKDYALAIFLCFLKEINKMFHPTFSLVTP